MVPAGPGLGGGPKEEDREARYREIMRSRHDPSTYYAHLGMRLEGLGEGSSRFTMTASPHFLNAGGVVHGGVLASVADAAVAAALATLVDPEREAIATVEMKINYIAPVRGGDIVCEARIIQKGRSVAVGESSVFNGEGRLVAKAMATFIVKEKPVS
ncbi:MAG: PaaI family thioesterase [Actinomycetota bacterium]